MRKVQLQMYLAFMSLGLGLSCTAPDAALEQQPQALSPGGTTITLAQVAPIPGTVGRIAPRFSPDSDWLLVSGPGYQGLYRLTFDGREELLSDSPWGYWARFSGRELVTVDLTGEEWRHGPDGWRRTGPREPSQTPADFRGVVYAQREDRIVALEDGSARGVMGQKGDRFFRPQLSPDGRRLLAQEMASGIHVLDLASGEAFHVGTGSNPVWFPDSQRILFNRSQDDGATITASELFVYDLSNGVELQLTNTPQRHEILAAVSPDGEQIAFEAEQRIYRGRVVQHTAQASTP
jgi:hypothetical protein